MICKACNQTIGDNAKFCPFCGQAVSGSAMKLCPSCNKQYDSGQIFCEDCGTKLVDKTPTPTSGPAPRQTPSSGSSTAPRHAPASSYPSLTYNMSMYEGTGGIAKASGKLKVYSDRLEFEKTMGSAIGNAFGLIGMAVARSNARKNGAIDTYYYRDVVGVTKGSIMMCPAFTLRLRSGRTISFAGAAMGGNVDKTISIIQRSI